MQASPTPDAPAPPPRFLFVRIVEGLSTVCGVIASILILAAIGITCQMLYVRFVMGLSTVWQTEAVTFMMIAATLLGLPYVQKVRGHVNVDLVPMMLPPGVRRILALAVLLASIVLMAIVFWYGIEMWHVAYERNWRTDTIWAPLQWPIYLTVPVGFGLFLLQLIADFIGVVTGTDDPFAAPVPHGAAPAPEDAR